MKRLLFLIAAAALVLPATASAKGPSEATITGPGLGKAIRITGPEAEGSPLMNLAEAAGFFPAAFGQTPDPMAYARPKGDLGPRYSIDYDVPGPDGGNDKIHQDLYPYAKPGAWTHMAAGQPIFDCRHTAAGSPTRGSKGSSSLAAYQTLRRPRVRGAPTPPGSSRTGRSEPSCSSCSESEQQQC